MKRLIPLALLATAACSAPSLTAPSSPALEYRTITYSINVPDPYAAQSLIQVHPEGVYMAPVEAQRQYDFTEGYHGTPNVYAGSRQPDALRTYSLAGVVIAPLDVASRATFPASMWPDEYGQFPKDVYLRWLGRFVYTEYHER